MSARPTVLLTNDDGIESRGISSLEQALEGRTDVTVVCPSSDQSGVGRTLSTETTVERRDGRYLIDGTPTDCVLYALHELDVDPDIVVSGCNDGANIGAYGFGRSGTIGAAVEAAYHGLPAIAVSRYYDGKSVDVSTGRSYGNLADVVSYLLDRVLESGVFDEVDYLNVNYPMKRDDRTLGMQITEPARIVAVSVETDGDAVVISDDTWDHMDEHPNKAAAGTDHGALSDYDVSITPLKLPCEPTCPDQLRAIVNEFEARH